MRRPTRAVDGSRLRRPDHVDVEEFVIVVWSCDDPACEGACISPWYRKLAVPKDRMREGGRLTMPHPSTVVDAEA